MADQQQPLVEEHIIHLESFYNDESGLYMVDTFDEFLKIKDATEIGTYTKYNITSVDKAFSEEIVEIQNKPKLIWYKTLPYFHIGAKVYQCHQGRDMNLSKKKKYHKQREALAESNTPVRKYKKHQISKKLNCPVTISVKRIFILPDYQISDTSNKTEKTRVSKKIKELLVNEHNTLDGKVIYIFNLPEASDHQNHVVAKVGAIEPLDERIRTKIKQLVAHGVRDTTAIAQNVSVFVKEDLQLGEQQRSRFNPDKSVIQSIAYQVKKELQWSHSEQLRVQDIVERIGDGLIFFRPEGVFSSEEDNSSSLLFVYQSTEMQRLYQRYGQSCILIEPVVRTCKLPFPLYFVVVHTNVSYQVVALIFVQHENVFSLTEALCLLQNANPNVCPKYALTDYSKDDIEALKNVFPNIQTFISPFHRDLVWSRRLNTKDLQDVPKGKGMTLLRNIANAPTQDKMSDALYTLQHWKNYTESLMDYLESSWFEDMSMWITESQPKDLYFHTNNGIEKLNEDLKYSKLKMYRNSSLPAIVEMLLEQYCPERYAEYLNDNISMQSSSDVDIPIYLYGRPKWLIQHMAEAMNTARDIEANRISRVADQPNSFAVTPRSDDVEAFNVNFDPENQIVSCNCLQFTLTHLVCKHIIAVGNAKSQWSIQAIASWLFTNPAFSIDNDALGIPESKMETVFYEDTVCNVIVQEDIDYQQVEISNVSKITEQQADVKMEIEQTEENCEEVIETEIIEMPEQNEIEIVTESDTPLLQTEQTNRPELITQCESEIQTLRSIIGELNTTDLHELLSWLREGNTMLMSKLPIVYEEVPASEAKQFEIVLKNL